jgi:hypothetical protein
LRRFLIIYVLNLEQNNEGEMTMNEEVRDFHFNVNVRTGSGSKAKMANNEDSFLRAIEIQERKRAKKELENPKQEEVTEIPIAEVEEMAPAEPIEINEAPIVQPPPIEPAKAPPTPKPSGGGVPGPKPRNDFTAEERAAMLKRARAHAAEVQARKSK